MIVVKFRRRSSTKIAFEVEIGDEYASKTVAEQRGVAIVKALSEKKDLSGADLSYSNLSYSDLSYSNLSYSDLSYSNLSGSNLSGSNLRGSNLRGSDLRGSNLRGSDLRGSNLRGSNLRDSDLSGSNLRGSNLRGSDLRGSNLRGSDLRGSNLSGSNLRGSDLIVIQTDIWTAYIQKEHIRIGCQHHKASEWFAFSDDEIGEMDNRALAWWKKWKPVIKAAHEAILEGEPA